MASITVGKHIEMEEYYNNIIQHYIWNDEELAEAAKKMSQNDYDKMINDEVENCIYSLEGEFSYEYESELDNNLREAMGIDE